MPLPAELRPPLSAALARPVPAIPTPDAMLGSARFEPKWDGFRLLIVVDDSELAVIAELLRIDTSDANDDVEKARARS